VVSKAPAAVVPKDAVVAPPVVSIAVVGLPVVPRAKKIISGIFDILYGPVVASAII
jgi:hypothetical protein